MCEHTGRTEREIERRDKKLSLNSVLNESVHTSSLYTSLKSNTQNREQRNNWKNNRKGKNKKSTYGGGSEIKNIVDRKLQCFIILLCDTFSRELGDNFTWCKEKEMTEKEEEMKKRIIILKGIIGFKI